MRSARLRSRQGPQPPLEKQTRKHCGNQTDARWPRIDDRIIAALQHSTFQGWIDMVRAPFQEVAMSLKATGIIELPDSADTLFDHGAFDSKSRRVFVAHTT